MLDVFKLAQDISSNTHSIENLVFLIILIGTIFLEVKAVGTFNSEVLSPLPYITSWSDT